jgi:hypothetical protein
MKQSLGSAQHVGQARQGQGDEPTDAGTDGEGAEKGASLDADDRLLPCLFVMGKGMKIRNFERQ